MSVCVCAQAMQPNCGRFLGSDNGNVVLLARPSGRPTGCGKPFRACRPGPDHQGVEPFFSDSISLKRSPIQFDRGNACEEEIEWVVLTPTVKKSTHIVEVRMVEASLIGAKHLWGCFFLR
jgi:hypothetical protein